MSIPTGALVSESTDRPEISVFWQPGCSSCLKAKEFVAEHGFEFESINIRENPLALGEIEAAGLRSIPAVRRGDTYIYAQSLDDIAELLGVARNVTRLSWGDLIARWDDILEMSKSILLDFNEPVLQRQVISGGNRTIADLGAHIFQVAESFMRQIGDDSIDARAIYLGHLDYIQRREGLIAYVGKTQLEYREFRAASETKKFPSKLNTHYGFQPLLVVLERSVWHSTQHARQLDHVAAGCGAELRISEDLYSGLPLPKRLWT